MSFAAGDFDGNGAADQLIGYQDAGGTWWVQLALDYGYATETAVPGPVTAVGATSFGTGQDVAYAYVDSGASTQLAIEGSAAAGTLALVLLDYSSDTTHPIFQQGQA